MSRKPGSARDEQQENGVKETRLNSSGTKSKSYTIELQVNGRESIETLDTGRPLLCLDTFVTKKGTVALKGLREEKYERKQKTLDALPFSGESSPH